MDGVLKELQDHADHPSAFLAMNTGNEYFTVPGRAGVIAYRSAGRYLMQFGGVFAPEGAREELLRDFLDFARARRSTVAAVQLQSEDVSLYARCGFTVNQVGASYSLRLTEFGLKGSRFVKLRNKVSRARRSGLTVSEEPYEAIADAVRAIDRQWLRGKGRHVKEIEFLVGQLGGPGQAHRRLFAGRIAGEPVAYISYAPAFGRRPGLLHDLSRRVPRSAPGLLEAINLTAVETFRAEGAEWLHLGFTPFTGLAPEHEAPSASRPTAWFLRQLAAHGEKVYPAASQLAYKQKWAPHLVLPEYLAFQGRARAGAIWRLLRVTNSL
ncbi:bifunctional lysylphosphatidylglycerol flippase/synthetase MprF [Streptomyces sp. NPDC001691]|uniref:bifunctional lysylphosphatidylglycerol flippase/synthetase MprF n=1 Tax=Streptomyces sp. NPDC001691 TaxID=3364600 RepID=UPI0036A18A8C